MKKMLTSIVTLVMMVLTVLTPTISASADSSYGWTFPVLDNTRCYFWSILRIEPTEENVQRILNIVVGNVQVSEEEALSYDFYPDGKLSTKDACVLSRMLHFQTFEYQGKTVEYNIKNRYAIGSSDLEYMQLQLSRKNQSCEAIKRYDFNRNGKIDQADYTLAVSYNIGMDIIKLNSIGLDKRISFKELESNINLVQKLGGKKMTMSNLAVTGEIPYGAVVFYNGNSYIYHGNTLVLPTKNPRQWYVYYFTENIQLDGFYITYQ